MTRAAPLPLDERRAALIAATEPLLERFGREVSTKQIAEAAGIAEGTIFRAFAPKEALIDAVIEDAFGIQRTCDELAQVDLALSLEKRLVAAVVILQERLRRVLALFGSLRLRKEAHDYDSFRAKQQADNELLNSAIVPLIKPDQDQLRLAAIEAVFVSASLAAAAELFATRVRSSGYSIGYNVSVALFGGTAPYIATWLVDRTGNVLAPAFYVIAAAIVTLATVFTMRETAAQPLRKLAAP